MDKVDIIVTQADIDQGEQCQAGTCPIALAAERTTGLNVSVGIATLTLFDGNTMIDYTLPDEAVEFINKFDSHEGLNTVEPFTFTAERA